MAKSRSTANKPESKLKQKIKKHKRWQRDKTTHRLLFIYKADHMEIV